jgi:hypothetical protein
MSMLPVWIPRLFIVAAIYYGGLGATGIWWPELWYRVSGISAGEGQFFVDAFGALLLALGAASLLAVFKPEGRPTLILVLFLANLFDLFVIVGAVFSGQLGIGPGALFIGADSTWLLVLGYVLSINRKAAIAQKF